MKKILTVALLIVISSTIAYLFWQNEWKYSLPTPVPNGYNNVLQGSFIAIGGKMSTGKAKPSFIHFFNPDCPCSRFNLQHFAGLVSKYHKEVDFSVVVIDKSQAYDSQSIRRKFNLNVPVSFDTSIATLCGVYSTPQAVLLDGNSHLYYRGNYNKSRYCTMQNSNYAQMAIDSLLQHSHTVNFGLLSTKAYGCAIKSCILK